MTNEQKILILVDQVTNRLKYTFDYVFTQRLGLSYILTENSNEFDQYSSAKVNYSHYNFQGQCAVSIIPYGLLNESNINLHNVIFQNHQGIPAIFLNTGGFDLFSAIFYVLSRYEEYGSTDYDVHGRFKPQNSVLYQNGLLQTPVVDLWVDFFKGILLKHYPWIVFRDEKYAYLPTIDVDEAFAYKCKSFLLTCGGLVRSVFRNNWHDFNARVKVLMRLDEDPFYTFPYINELLKKHNVSFIYFYLMNNKNRLDSHILLDRPPIRTMIQNNTEYAETGLHPSYESWNNIELISRERKFLESISGIRITKSRQHFLRFRLPETYRCLINAGILEDYSMGYASAIGFRAGTCHPFYFFDLEKNETTSLKIFPVHAMDATYIHYLKFTTDEALNDLLQLKNTVKKYKGNFTVIWHNNTFEPTTNGLKWREVFEKIINK